MYSRGKKSTASVGYESDHKHHISNKLFLSAKVIVTEKAAGHLRNNGTRNMTLIRSTPKMQGCDMSVKKIDLEAMSVDDLWSLHERISGILSARITAEKRELEKRLAVLNRGRDAIEVGDAPLSYNANGKVRRKYPRVVPKYRNPQTPSETWSGRGKQPRWLAAAIKTGRKIEDFRIGESLKGRRQTA